MTTFIPRKYSLILAIAPSSRGFGYAVLENNGTLVDWGVKTVKGDKNADSLKKADAMISLYHPAVFVLQDACANGSRRSPRIRELTKSMIALTARRKVSTVLFSCEQFLGTFFEDGKGTKNAIARIIAMRFPEELGHRLPRKRKAWTSEDYRMGIFDAVALAVATQLRDKRGECNYGLVNAPAIH